MLRTARFSFLLSALSTLLLALVISAKSNASDLIIIIDDIGNNYTLGKRIVDIDAPMTLAFLPHTPFAKKLAIESHNSGKENILHAPMENTSAAPLGPGALTLALNEEEFKQSLNGSIASIPFIQGINNHMGSLLTESHQQMQWVMKALTQHNLYFIDSLTTPKSVAFKYAQQDNIPALKRDVFLDNTTEEAQLNRQWNKAIRLAKQRGHAVLIAHPYAETSKFLAQKIPQLEGIKLRTASEFILQRAWQGFATHHDLSYNRYWLAQHKEQKDTQRIEENNNNQNQSTHAKKRKQENQDTTDTKLISHLP